MLHAKVCILTCGAAYKAGLRQSTTGHVEHAQQVVQHIPLSF